MLGLKLNTLFRVVLSSPDRLQSRSVSGPGGVVINSRVGSPLKLPVADQDDIPSPVVSEAIAEVENGSPLCRVSTAPEDSASERSREHARQVASAIKLARMGFAAGGDVRNGVVPRSASPRPSSGSKARFGGLRTFMQTLTGK